MDHITQDLKPQQTPEQGMPAIVDVGSSLVLSCSGSASGDSLAQFLNLPSPSTTLNSKYITELSFNSICINECIHSI